TYTIGKEWFNGVVGLIAAFIMAIHPYLIELSVRGLRAEWFATLVLLFVYYSFVKLPLDARLRTLITGLLIGCMLLTRSESLLMVVICLVVYPLAARTKWNYKMVFTALLLGITLLIPHQYRMYKNYGDPLYTVNQYTRFYANREFAGKPGFPTEEELATKGMYTGGKITPFEYYFSLHTPGQIVQYSTIGFLRIHLTMPLYFALGKGNLKSMEHALEKLKTNPNFRQLVASVTGTISILKRNLLDYALASLFLVSFVLGVLLIAFSPHRMLLVFMFIFQVQTSFIAYVGIDTRLTVHSYPFIALCCGYSLGWLGNLLWRNLIRLRKDYVS
ncbi:MAG: glycosyltransferase family 39 protein, partial [Thermodesulfobacteriota bacterium]|nr:glycosyltransferase family 39 protein [Thermodesulfobacteriota bacterium]